MANSTESLEESSSLNKDKLKEYGSKAYVPLVKVLFKYQDQMTPYFMALQKGLGEGAKILSQESVSSEEKYVSAFFLDAAKSLDSVIKKLQAHDPQDFAHFISELSRKRPVTMFSASYVTGLFLGRLGKHLARQDSEKPQEFSSKRFGESTKGIPTDRPLH